MKARLPLKFTMTESIFDQKTIGLKKKDKDSRNLFSKLYGIRILNLYSYPTNFGQEPVLVIFVLKCSLLQNFHLFYIVRSACLFWSKQATNILKIIKILFLMVLFHNAPSNFTNLASGKTGIGYQSP